MFSFQIHPTDSGYKWLIAGMTLRVLFVDFDSYFASCEQELHPELRGRPVGVVPMLADTTCCIAASYEAKAFGVKTGTKVSEARSLCPEIVFVEAKHDRYVRIHHDICEAVERCVPVSEVKSIDELYAELPPSWRTEEKARSLATEIRQRVRDKVGEYIGCSIGIGPNVFLSKMGSGMQKPRGLTVIRKEDLPGCLYQLDLSDIHGVGRQMLLRLQTHGIHTVKQLCAAERRQLHTIWGSVEGDRLYAELRGEWIERDPTSRRQVGHSHVLPPHLRNREDGFSVLHRLTQKAAMRLRRLDYYAGSLAISIRFLGGSKWSGAATFFETQHTPLFLEALRKLWESIPGSLGNPLKVSVVLSSLIPAQQFTPSLFSGGWAVREEAIDRAMDKINLSMGPRTLYYAGAHEGMGEAPMRIAFTHVPDLDVEGD